jgi:hypothetical protein
MKIDGISVFGYPKRPVEPSSFGSKNILFHFNIAPAESY